VNAFGSFASDSRMSCYGSYSIGCLCRCKKQLFVTVIIIIATVLLISLLFILPICILPNFKFTSPFVFLNSVCVCIYIYIYIYRERERERVLEFYGNCMGISESKTDRQLSIPFFLI
jgi:hypothetical protein